ncbi:MAG: hypothetical protein COX81_02810 [Candidatus Magasanikbacteria bacterium CG_4_10_14_0_2_um_filter_37_12]|uniref:Acylphosphatase-like domain-containing protein n=1 Tax=Candidatus Magasanikbacteria bacterium CG_4_10_14_0_2_um_filter_37_12 TaxID=1974637 RepID=A0A2M7V7J2_9BACT|nr:MAG: hypothetical protein COX81_02810 [Candidatus Magasanikbacteria bacterium CG_4_10_14_0_2_um_filter_37_12]
MSNFLTWDLYEVTSEDGRLVGNSVRGRVRKFALQQNINLLVENSQDKENTIIFALLSGNTTEPIVEFIKNLFPDVHVESIGKGIENPVLSRFQVNLEDRYNI